MPETENGGYIIDDSELDEMEQKLKEIVEKAKAEG